MAKHLCLFFSLLFLVSTTCFALRKSQFYECQLDRLNALGPDHRIEHEGGLTESWNANHPELRCAGVAFIRRTIYTRGLHLPSYSNSAQLHFIIQGRGVIGTAIPGCAETFEEPQSRYRQDRHQKVRYFKAGDVIAIPYGTPYWTYNYGRSPVIAVTLIDTTNEQNQLDANPRIFYLAGNPKEEHPETQGGRKQHLEGNIFSGFDNQLLVDTLNIDEETARKLQSRNGQGDQIVRVRQGFRIIIPREQQGEEECMPGRWYPGRGEGEEEPYPYPGQQEEGEEQEGYPGARHQGQGGHQPEQKGQESYPGERRPGQGGHHSEQEEQEGYPGERQPGESYPSERQPGQGGYRPGQEEQESYPGQRQPGQGKYQPGQEEQESYPGRRQPGQEGYQPGQKEQESYPGRRQPGQEKHKSYPGKKQSGQGGSQPGPEEEESYPGERQPGKGGYQPGQEEEESYPSERQPGQGGYQPGQEEEESYPGRQPGRRPGQEEQESYPGKKQPGQGGHQPGQEEQESYPSKKQPGQGGHQPGQEGQQSYPGKSQPGQEEYQPGQEEEESYPGGKRPGQGGRQPGQEEQESYPGERQPGSYRPGEEEGPGCRTPRPPTRCEQECARRGQGNDNGLEETICTMKLRKNIARTSSADLYNPSAGRISNINSLDLPILRWLRLSAQYVVLYRNAMFAPHWNINANSLMYVTRGQGRVQVVNNQGRSVFNGEVRRGQLLVVPQNFVVAQQAGSEGLEFIAFKTNDKAMISPLSGTTSAIRGMPAEVLANVFGLRTYQVSALKYGRNEGVLVSPRPQSQRYLVKVAQMVV